jgi:antiviral helicase SLH1
MSDPGLVEVRNKLIKLAAEKLEQAKMIAFDSSKHNFISTDLGRIAAKYYIQYKSVELFNRDFRRKMTEADVIALLSSSTEVGFCCCLFYDQALIGMEVRSNSIARVRG